MLHGLTYNAKLVIIFNILKIVSHVIILEPNVSGVADGGGVHHRFVRDSQKWRGRLWRRARCSSMCTRNTKVEWPIVAACTDIDTSYERVKSGVADCGGVHGDGR
jgi:hypothetical protein